MEESPLTRISSSEHVPKGGSHSRLLLPYFINGKDPSPLSLVLIPPGSGAPPLPECDGAFLLVSSRVGGLSSGGAVTVEADPELCRWLLSTFHIIEEMQYAGSFAGMSACRHLADAVMDTVFHRTAEVFPHAGSRTAPELLAENARRFIEARCGENITLSMVADRLFVTPSYLSRIFHQITGMTFCSFVRETRLKKAVELLDDSMLSITEIAAASGLGTVSHMGAMFRKKYGVSPNAYRRSSADKRYQRWESTFPRINKGGSSE